MRLLRNPITYLLVGFSLFLYAPFLFSGLLLFIALEPSIAGQSVAVLVGLSALFLLVFVFSGVYVQALLFSYAQQSSRAQLLDVFKGARKQFWRVFLLDGVVLALILPVVIIWFLHSSVWTSLLLLVWSALVGLVFLFVPRFIHKYGVCASIKKSSQVMRKQVRRVGVVVGLAGLATIVSALPAFESLSELSLASGVVFFFASIASGLLSVSAFFPALLVSGWGGSILVALFQRVVAIAFMLVMLHVVCAKSLSSD